MDPHHLDAFLFAKLGEVHSAYTPYVIQIGAFLVLSRCYGEASLFRSAPAPKSRGEAAALHRTCGEWVGGWAWWQRSFNHPGFSVSLTHFGRDACSGDDIWQ